MWQGVTGAGGRCGRGGARPYRLAHHGCRLVVVDVLGRRARRVGEALGPAAAWLHEVVHVLGRRARGVGLAAQRRVVLTHAAAAAAHRRRRAVGVLLVAPRALGRVLLVVDEQQLGLHDAAAEDRRLRRRQQRQHAGLGRRLDAPRARPDRRAARRRQLDRLVGRCIGAAGRRLRAAVGGARRLRALLDCELGAELLDLGLWRRRQHALQVLQHAPRLPQGGASV